MMDDHHTDDVINSTVSDRATYDKQCCSSEDISALDRFLNVDLPVLIWKFLPPVILVLGTFGNVMTIVIMRRMSQSQSSNTMYLYFTALAVSDTIILFSGLLLKWVFHTYQIVVEEKSIFLCKVPTFLVYCSCLISAWVIASMTMQRVMSVSLSHYKSLSCSKIKVELVIGTIVAVSCALPAFKLYGYELVTKPNATHVVCMITNQQLFEYNFVIYPLIDLVLSTFIPFTILIVCNSVLMVKVIQSVQVARVMTSGSCDQVNSRQKKASSLTVTLITVSMVFLLLSLPICIYLIAEPESNADEPPYLIFDIMWYVNSAINFYLYCLTGSRFRNEVKSLLCRRPPALKDP